MTTVLCVLYNIPLIETIWSKQFYLHFTETETGVWRIEETGIHRAGLIFKHRAVWLQKLCFMPPSSATAHAQKSHSWVLVRLEGRINTATLEPLYSQGWAWLPEVPFTKLQRVVETNALMTGGLFPTEWDGWRELGQ